MKRIGRRLPHFRKVFAILYQSPISSASFACYNCYWWFHSSFSGIMLFAERFFALIWLFELLIIIFRNHPSSELRLLLLGWIHRRSIFKALSTILSLRAWFMHFLASDPRIRFQIQKKVSNSWIAFVRFGNLYKI